jgi:hypothetical protein
MSGPTEVTPRIGHPDTSSTTTEPGERAHPETSGNNTGRDLVGGAAAAVGLGGVYEGYKNSGDRQTQDSSQGVTGIATGGTGSSGTTAGRGPHDSSVANKLDPR